MLKELLTQDDSSLTLFCAVALKGAMNGPVLPAFTQGAGTVVDARFAPTPVLVQEALSGADFDVIIGTEPALASLFSEGSIGAPTGVLARSGIGIAVAAGADIPDISTTQKLVNVMGTARSVSYSLNGPSGIYFGRLLQDLGIAEQVNRNATIIEEGFTTAALLDGRADVAVQQLSELVLEPGAKIAGPLPPDVQHYTAFSAAIAAQTKNGEGAETFLTFLGSTLAHSAYSGAGLEPN